MMLGVVLDETNLSSEIFDGEVVAVNFATGKYYGMKGSAQLIWEMLRKPVDPTMIETALRTGYPDLDDDDIASVRGFLDLLAEEGILLPASPIELPKLPDISSRASFMRPELEIHTDLQELIVLDPIHDVDPGGGWPLRR
ncbi:MAG: PqqD family protein, partial [Mesorhizobium sp.]